MRGVNRKNQRSPQAAHNNGLRGGAAALLSSRHPELLPMGLRLQNSRERHGNHRSGLRSSNSDRCCPQFTLAANSAIENIAAVSGRPANGGAGHHQMKRAQPRDCASSLY